MARPLVAIVGRPNVGKSTFFNQMAGRRIAIVEDTPGVTRDRVYADCEWQNHKFTLIDTGGIDPQSDDPLLSQMRRQAEIAVETVTDWQRRNPNQMEVIFNVFKDNDREIYEKLLG